MDETDSLEIYRLYAKAWNRLDPEIIEPYLFDSVEYSSQQVWETLKGKDTVFEYLSGKMAAIRDSSAEYKVYAEIGYCGSQKGKAVQLFGADGDPCVVMAQGNVDNPSGIVLLRIDDSKIVSIALCSVVPNPKDAVRTGEYPE